MQVSPNGGGGAGGAARAGVLLLPSLLRMTAGSPQTRALREEAEEREREERQRADSEGAAASGAGQNSTLQALADAERRMAPGSAAARRADSRRADEQAAWERRGAFQRSLSEARGQRRSGSTRADAREAVRPNVTARAAGRTSEHAKVQNVRAGDASSPVRSKAQAGGGAESATPAGAAARGAAVNAGTPGAAVPVDSGGAQREAVEAVGAFRAAALSGRAANAGGAHTPLNAEAPAGRGPPAPAAADPAAPAARSGRAGRPAAQVASGAERNKGALSEQIVRVLRSQISRARSSATIRLDPAELGTVRVHLELEKNVLALRMEPQTEVAHRLLSEQLDWLRRGLEAAGIQLERVEVRPPAEAALPGQATPDQQEAGQPGGQRSDPDAEHPAAGGTESPFTDAEPAEPECGGQFPEAAAESRVNVLA